VSGVDGDCDENTLKLPIGSGNAHFSRVPVQGFRDALAKNLVAIEAIAVYCTRPGSQNGNPFLADRNVICLERLRPGFATIR
jgi:hypothetical protein